MLIHYLIIFVLGALFGGTINRLINFPVGTLYIDKNDLNKELYRFELNDLQLLDKKRYITLKTKHITNTSQK